MRKVLNYVVGVAAIAAIVVLFLLTKDGLDRFLGALIILGTWASCIGLNHQIPRKPKLVVRYENRDPALGSKPVIHQHRGAGDQGLNVVLYNEGKGEAEGIRVRFEATGANHIWNETGNETDPMYLNKALEPPQFTGHGIILAPDGGRIVLAYLTFRPFPGHEWTPPRTFKWEAFAKGMKPQSGTVEIEIR